MKAFVAITDKDWFEFLRQRPELTEVNFWQPGGGRQFRALEPGQPLLFKLHYPDHYIAGGGFFATFSILPVSLAWSTFGVQNGVPTYVDMRKRIEFYRRVEPNTQEDYEIGCIILEDPFFLDKHHWIEAPSDFSKNTVVGKAYDLTTDAGGGLWERVLQARALERHAGAEAGSMYGSPTLFTPRLGQGAFRVAVTDAYERRCAVTGEKTLPVLEAAHIQPVSQGGGHRVDNGLLLRSDLHTLFDIGYVTISRNYRFRVSTRLKQDFDNGAHYRALEDILVRTPSSKEIQPARELLEWHGDVVFRG